MKPISVKSETDDAYTLHGWAVLYDGHDDAGKDLTDEYFAPETDFWFKTLGTTKPFLYGHGRDSTIGRRVLGTATLKEMDEGVWFEAEISKAAKYAEKVRELADKGVLGASTGAVEHLIEREPRAGKTFLKSWPIAELSATVTPAEPRTVGVEAVKELAEYAEGLKAVLTAGQRDRMGASDFAFMDSNGTGHMPINDAAHCRAAMARFDQTDFPDAETKRRAARRILARARELGIDVAPDSAVAQAAKALDLGDDTIKAIADAVLARLHEPDGAAPRPAPANAEDPPAGKAKEPGMKTLAERIAIDLLLAEVD